ncbi:MAG TPA: STAS domain-containing protein [Gemmatimonadota bacterium]|nr:STAS domain-containing protein [Gemmatimonadota bacterium]
MSEPMLVVEREYRSDGIVVLALSGELVVTSREALREEAESELVNGARHLVVAVDRLSHIDTTGLAMLVYLAGRCAERGGRMAVAGLKADVQEMRQHLFLDEAIRFADHVGDAVAAVARPG